jgi:hypothetical protein
MGLAFAKGQFKFGSTMIHRYPFPTLFFFLSLHYFLMKFIELVTNCSRKQILDNTSFGEPGHITSLCLCCGLLPFTLQATVSISLCFGFEGAFSVCCSAKAYNVGWYPSFAKAVDRISFGQAKQSNNNTPPEIRH